MKPIKKKTLENFISYLYILDPGHKVSSIHETPMTVYL